MTPVTLGRFLLGDRRAILDVAATRLAWMVGLVFVLSAGLAREYDHEDLLREPWHALLPLGASLVTATILHAIIRAVSWWRSGTGWPRRGGYLSFLGLYWATAPLAWLYAIPVERFLPVEDAVAANLWLLGIVSLWRVLLMSRVVQVVWHCHAGEAVTVVGFFAVAVAMAALFLTPIPVLSIMGGIELAPAEAMLAATTFFTGLFLFLSAPFWLVAFLAVFAWRRRPGGSWTPDPAFASGALPVARSLWVASSAAVAAGLALLPLTQPEQWLRREVERALRGGDPSAALRLMAGHARADFPPHWDPPPRTSFGERSPRLTDVIEAIAAVDPPAWVRDTFFAKLPNAEQLHSSGGSLQRLDDDDLARYVAVLERLPEGRSLAATHAPSIKRLLQWNDRGRHEDDPSLPPGASRRALFDRVLALAGEDGQTQGD